MITVDQAPNNGWMWNLQVGRQGSISLFIRSPRTEWHVAMSKLKHSAKQKMAASLTQHLNSVRTQEIILQGYAFC